MFGETLQALDHILHDFIHALVDGDEVLRDLVGMNPRVLAEKNSFLSFVSRTIYSPVVPRFWRLGRHGGTIVSPFQPSSDLFVP